MPFVLYSSLRRFWTSLVLVVLISLSAHAQACPRIAVLNAGHAEIIEALGAGDQLVLMPNDPSLQGHLPEATRYHRPPSAESLLAEQPQYVIAGTPARHRGLLKQAERLGIEPVMIGRTLPPAERIRRLAEYVDRVPQGRQLIQHIEQDHATAKRIADGRPDVRVLHLSSSGAGSTGTVTGAGAATSADALIRRAGGINVGAEAGLERYQSLSAEGVMSMAPQAVLVSRLELPELGGAEGIWQQVPGLAHTPAASAQRLIVLDHAAVKFDGATSGQATRTLAEALHTP
ncbi:heme/hemin ABC transporter substrate-binding protein [Aidingimonas lacisalsi]|uniref:heme/hemin ABC transporter substrate-binding protein n=1 Tax=Aidingimonas lacisalsi TaxID=2604086 RepID=UPI0011D23C08|nr:ABC transporter substrate-binding protein [Aidingimonas lacisalsi]